MYKSAKFWDRIADKYAAMPIRNPQAYEALLDQVRARVRPEDILLELGCGTGSTAIALAPDVARFVATDVSEAMLAKGREKASAEGIDDIDFAQADAAHAPKGPFDMVLAFNLLHLLDDLDTALADIAVRVKPGGLFVSKTFCMPDRRDLIWWFVRTGLPLMQMIGKAPYFGKIRASDLDAAIESAGFTILDSQTAPGRDPRRTIVARRSD